MWLGQLRFLILYYRPDVQRCHAPNTHLCTPFFSSPLFSFLPTFSLTSILPLYHFLSLHFLYHFSLIHSPFFPPHFTYPSWWMRVHYKNHSSLPGSLSRSDVVACEEWRRCIHESRWCSPKERNRQRVGGGGKREMEDWARRQGEDREMKGDKEMGVEREVTEGDRWRRGMWEGTDWWMNVCAGHGDANANLLHQASVSNWSDV